jgi:AcrR family transcriptional regulator
MTVTVISLACLMTATVMIAYHVRVGRWEPGAKGRLMAAAMELYLERGYDSTTVADIAERAGLTERTFFRHYADKREVLFAGAGEIQELLVSKVIEAPAELAPLEAIVEALAEVAAIVFEPIGEYAVQRQALITGNTELRERELIKMATLGAAVAEALRGRGVGEPAASLAGEAGIAIFRIAFERWISDSVTQPLANYIREAADELALVTGGLAGR